MDYNAHFGSIFVIVKCFVYVIKKYSIMPNILLFLKKRDDGIVGEREMA